MPFTLHPFRRFPVCCPVTYRAGLCEGHGMIRNLSCTGWRTVECCLAWNPSYKVRNNFPRNLFIGYIPCVHPLSGS